VSSLNLAPEEETMCTIMTAHRSGAVAEGGASHAAGSGNEVGQSRRRV